MVADVTETRNVIPSLEFKTCMTIKSKIYLLLFKFRDSPRKLALLHNLSVTS